MSLRNISKFPTLPKFSNLPNIFHLSPITPIIPKFPINSLFFGRNWLAGLCCWTKLARCALLLDEIGSLRSLVGRNWLAVLADLVCLPQGPLQDFIR